MAALFELRDVHVSVAGARILAGVSLALRPGSLALVLGRSGTGKSVLLKAAVGFLPMESGGVWLEGKQVESGKHLARLRSQVTLVHQDPALLDEETALHNVALPLMWRERMGRRQAEKRAEEALTTVGSRELARERVVDLSAGQRKRISLARALALRPKVLLLDEPTTGLDAPSARRVGLTCGDIARGGTALLVVTHDVAPFAEVADEVHVLGGGTLLSSQPAGEALRSPSPPLHQLLQGAPQGPLTGTAELEA